MLGLSNNLTRKYIYISDKLPYSLLFSSNFVETTKLLHISKVYDNLFSISSRPFQLLLALLTLVIGRFSVYSYSKHTSFAFRYTTTLSCPERKLRRHELCALFDDVCSQSHKPVMETSG